MMRSTQIAILANFKSGYKPHQEMHKCFEELRDSYGFTFEWLPTELLQDNAAVVLIGYSGIIAGSGPYQSKQGILNGIRYARLNNIPFLGTCSGFGYAVLEFGQSLFNLKDVFHPYERQDLSVYETFLQPLNCCPAEITSISFTPLPGTLTSAIYQNTTNVIELSHCVYGISLNMIPAFEAAGFICSAVDDEREPKIIEYQPNDFFIITLFLPQLNPMVDGPHPLIGRFLRAAINRN